MTLTALLTYAAALGVAAAIPGPGVTALVARALGSGFRPAFAMSFGLVLGDLAYLTAVVLGLAFIAQTFGMVFLVIKWLGIAYLAYLAWKFWTAGIMPETIEAKRKTGLVSNFLGGFALTIGNPKTMIFYIAIMPTVVDLSTITLVDYGVLALVTIVVLLIVLVPYLALAAKARGLLKSPRGLRLLSRGAAACLAGAAVAIAARQ